MSEKKHLKSVYIGLGSNLDNPVNQVLLAMESIGQHPAINLIARSSLYQTQPVGFIEQPDFINAVVHIETSLTPPDLLLELLKIEQQQGRKRMIRFGPRTLDLDILLYEDLVIQSETLTIPHPQMHERGFVLHPLFEIAPDLRLLQGDLRNLLPQGFFQIISMG